jgi:hypothetical protein
VLKLIHRWSFFSTLKPNRPDILKSFYSFSSSSFISFPKFDHHPEKISNLHLNAFTTSPFQDKNLTEDKFVEKILETKTSIIIDHLYFHPTKKSPRCSDFGF